MGTIDYSFSGQVALITGAKRGLGRELALAFAAAGADVAVCTRDVGGGALEAVVNDVKKTGRRCLGIQADTSRKADVDAMVEKVMKEFGHIDILVNNAAVLIKGMILDMPLADWERHFDVNVKGYYLVSRAVAAKMVERKKGSIINISSDLAFKAIPAHAAYCTSKAAIIMLTRALAVELGPHGIRVNGVAPGLFRTELSKPNWTNPEFMKHMEAITPLGRIGEPEEMVGATMFLASDAATYVSGSTILVNGGGLA